MLPKDQTKFPTLRRLPNSLTFTPPPKRTPSRPVAIDKPAERTGRPVFVLLAGLLGSPAQSPRRPNFRAGGQREDESGGTRNNFANCQIVNWFRSRARGSSFWPTSVDYCGLLWTAVGTAAVIWTSPLAWIFRAWTMDTPTRQTDRYRRNTRISDSTVWPVWPERRPRCLWTIPAGPHSDFIISPGPSVYLAVVHHAAHGMLPYLLFTGIYVRALFSYRLCRCEETSYFKYWGNGAAKSIADGVSSEMLKMRCFPFFVFSFKRYSRYRQCYYNWGVYYFIVRIVRIGSLNGILLNSVYWTARSDHLRAYSTYRVIFTGETQYLSFYSKYSSIQSKWFSK